MAKQNGIVPLKGTIGKITFYTSKAGHQARGKGLTTHCIHSEIFYCLKWEQELLPR